MIFNFMKDHRRQFPIEKMAQVFDVSRCGYYKYLRSGLSKRKTENAELLKMIKAVHKRSKGAYGSPKIHDALKQNGNVCSRKRVARIMQVNQIKSTRRKSWKRTARGSSDDNSAPNLLQQNFAVDAKNLVWVADITYIWTQAGWVYLAVVLDLFSRKIVGFSLSYHCDTGLIIRALEQAICHRMPDNGLIHHSDRGSQYRSQEFKEFTIRD